MNFLFLTTMMILIFSLVSSSMTRSIKTVVGISKNLTTQVDEYFTMQNTIAKADFNKSKKQKKNTEEMRVKERASKTFIARESFSGENSKLNLYPLFGGNYPNESKALITKTLQRLLTELYKDQSFYIKKINENRNFLNSFIKNLVLGLKKSGSLAKIAFPTRGEREFFLALCRKNPSSKKSPPSLLDYVTVQEITDEPFLNFKSVSKEILIAFFGKNLCKKIFDEEKKVYFKGRWSARLSEKELEPYINLEKYNAHKQILRYTKAVFTNEQTYTHTKKGHLITQGPPAQLTPL